MGRTSSSSTWFGRQDSRLFGTPTPDRTSSCSYPASSTPPQPLPLDHIRRWPGLRHRSRQASRRRRSCRGRTSIRSSSSPGTRLTCGTRHLGSPSSLRGALGTTEAAEAVLAPASSTFPWAPSAVRPRQDSNLRTRLRRPMLYPLSYEGGPGQVSRTTRANRLGSPARRPARMGRWPIRSCSSRSGWRPPSPPSPAGRSTRSCGRRTAPTPRPTAPSPWPRRWAGRRGSWPKR